MSYVTNVGRTPSNECLISLRAHSHVSQGQTAVKDVSGLSMKTGRAMLLQILTNGESQAIQFTMRSHRSLDSVQFASAKPVIDICQRKGWSMSAPKLQGDEERQKGALEAEDSRGICL